MEDTQARCPNCQVLLKLIPTSEEISGDAKRKFELAVVQELDDNLKIKLHQLAEVNEKLVESAKKMPYDT